MTPAPRYVVLEGIDGSGKSTLARGLCAALVRQNFAPVLLAEPTQSRSGREVRARITRVPAPDAEAQLALFTKNRMEHVAGRLGPLVEALRGPLAGTGLVLVQDRGLYSAPVYHAADEDFDAVLEAQLRLAPAADRVILVDVPVAAALARIEARAEARQDAERAERLEQLRSRYQRLARALGDRVQVVDGRRRPEELVDQLVDAHWSEPHEFTPTRRRALPVRVSRMTSDVAPEKPAGTRRGAG